MARCGNRQAFTLIEVLVASLLLGMLVVILTMVFNQSSIAWRTGKASVSQMDEMRRLLSQVQRRGGELLPGVDAGDSTKLGCVDSAWNNENWNGTRGSLNRRAVEKYDDSRFRLSDRLVRSSQIDPSRYNQAWFRPDQDFYDAETGKLKAFTVGVWSFGPDGQRETADDISTWPDNME